MNNTKTNTSRLETERLILRRFEPGDVDAILEIYGDPVVMKFVPVIPLKSKEEAEQLLWERYLSKYEAEYDGKEGTNPVLVKYSEIKDYTYHTNYITDSQATDKDYKHTEYTVDNGLVVMVTYRNAEGAEKVFILNYNVYAVDVIVDGVKYTLDKYAFAVKEG